MFKLWSNKSYSGKLTLATQMLHVGNIYLDFPLKCGHFSANVGKYSLPMVFYQGKIGDFAWRSPGVLSCPHSVRRLGAGPGPRPAASTSHKGPTGSTLENSHVPQMVGEIWSKINQWESINGVSMNMNIHPEYSKWTIILTVFPVKTIFLLRIFN